MLAPTHFRRTWDRMPTPAPAVSCGGHDGSCFHYRRNEHLDNNDEQSDATSRIHIHSVSFSSDQIDLISSKATSHHDSKPHPHSYIMAEMLGQGGLGGQGGMGGQGGLANGFPLEQWFWEMPPMTRWWTTSAVICSIMVQCHIVSPFNLFYSVRAVFSKGQVYTIRSGT